MMVVVRARVAKRAERDVGGAIVVVGGVFLGCSLTDDSGASCMGVMAALSYLCTVCMRAV